MCRWKQITEAEYDAALGELPPVIMTPSGFLQGECWYHTDDGIPMFSAYVTYKAHGFLNDVFAVSLEGMSIREFRKLNLRDVEYDVNYDSACRYYESLEGIYVDE